MRCPTCLLHIRGGYAELSDHIYNMLGKTDSNHIMWINRYVTRSRTSKKELEGLVKRVFETGDLKEWIIQKFIGKFFSKSPHQFLVKMQKPDRWTLLGYAYEHHHFLKQWVKSCSLIIANTDFEEIHHYEIDNIISEWHGEKGRFPAHHELLLKMGQSYGASLNDIYRTEPLEPTLHAIQTWDHICRNFSFVEGMAAMHSLELIANRKMKEYGASIGYFDPVILRDGSVTRETVDFLREGYEADVSHSEVALALIAKYSSMLNLQQEVQAVFFKSIEEFDNYLNARIERGAILENKQH